MMSPDSMMEMSSSMDCSALKRRKCGSFCERTTTRNSAKNTMNGVKLLL